MSKQKVGKIVNVFLWSLYDTLQLQPIAHTYLDTKHVEKVEKFCASSE